MQTVSLLFIGFSLGSAALLIIGNILQRQEPMRFASKMAGFLLVVGLATIQCLHLGLLLDRFDDPGPLVALLARPPLGIDTELFEKPASQAERWQAGLYFLKHLLRFAIALVWLWSGCRRRWTKSPLPLTMFCIGAAP